MKKRYLEVTFRRGRPLAPYLYLPRGPNERVYRTSTADPGLVIDFCREGKPIGIEITAPTQLIAAALNKVLSDLDLPLVEDSELTPLRAA